ncbi:concanavalin A-like lectin/glucanase domain-containing protein [Emericellopsis atlantica]|uniref:Concanavalin A-like lectin/glucanase domain-containing protein n=1 Tax=Emericellopsis atlantica TaxID=2614577 RepID=A0A9P8CP83_9HYPO|nr:concanavalin A-like lectin/glucanase domain-containing protein [Emericellopsis atlantica]KAG9252511.1 concanavalin A-like lectin/glucanase domain-containing protein [Emericellopsis atlantica]
MSCPNLILGSLLAMAAPAVAQNCDCYLIDGQYPTYFRNYGFWDFRSMSQYASSSPPPIPDTLEGQGQAPFTNEYLDYASNQFTKFWSPMNWTAGSDEFPMPNSYNNLYFENDEAGETDTFLTMRTARKPGFQTVAEFESNDYYDHASMRMRARTRGSPGACTAMFTYREYDYDVREDAQETDIEILTNDPTNKIRYTNQPSWLYNDDGEIESVPGASNEVIIDEPWDEWADHRLDWTPGRTTWYLNGDETFSMTFQVPTDPSRIVFNAWSNGDPEWSGLMPVGGAAYQHIQWIELAYNVVDAGSCSNVCNVDGGVPGSPQKI